MILVKLDMKACPSPEAIYAALHCHDADYRVSEADLWFDVFLERLFPHTVCVLVDSTSKIGLESNRAQDI